MSCTIGRSSTFGLNRSGACASSFSRAVRAERRLADDELVALTPDRRAGAVAGSMRKSESCRPAARPAAHGRARPARRRPLVASAAVRPGVGDLAAEHVGDERLDRRIGGVEHDQAVCAEQRFEPAGERIGHADARPVGGAERVEQPGRELGRRQCGCELVERRRRRVRRARARRPAVRRRLRAAAS